MGDKVKFLKGTQASVDSLISAKSGLTSGAFYLTNDSDRLYFAQSTDKLVLLNKTVVSVADVKSLPKQPAEGDFYYAKAENVLCTSIEGSWVQINPDTDTKVSGIKVVKNVSAEKEGEGGKNITFNVTLSQTNKDNGAIEPDITTSFKIDATDISQIASQQIVGLKSTKDTFGAKILTDGGGSEKGVILAKGTGINVTNDSDGKIIIANTDNYGISAANNQISLDNGNANKGKVAISAGTGIGVSTSDNTISVSHKAYEAPAQTNTDNGKFTAIDGLTLENGHVTGYNLKTLQVPENTDTTYKITSIGADNQGKISVALKASNGEPVTTTSKEGAISFTINGSTVNNKGNLGSFYTTAEIDNKLKGLNGIVYKGTVGIGGTVSALPSSKVETGHAYKAIKDGTAVGDGAYKEGDLLIATGEESEDGFIPASSIKWTVIPAGDDIDSTYKLQADNNAIKLVNTQNTSDAGTITFGKGKLITATTGTSDKGGVVTINHDAVTTTPATGNTSISGKTFDAITTVTTDGYGHLSGYKTTTFTLPENADKDTTYTLPSSAIDGGAKISLTSSGSVTDDVNFKGGTDIEVSHSADDITIGHKTYSDVNLESITAGQLKGGQSVRSLSELTSSNGHLTNATTASYILPTYALGNKNSATSNAGTFQISLSENGTAKNTIDLKLLSESLAFVMRDGGIGIDLEWGTF